MLKQRSVERVGDELPPVSVVLEPCADAVVGREDVKVVDILLAEFGVGSLQVLSATLARLVAERVPGPRVLEPLTLHVAEDEEKGRQPLLAIDQLPLVAVLLHDHGLQVVRLVAALPDVV